MQVSDLHVGRWFPRSYLMDAMRTAQRMQPDIVVYTGDYISYEGPKQIKQLREVLQHAVRGRLGTLAVLGNHDYGYDWVQDKVAEKVVYELRRAGIIVLRNAIHRINGLAILGIDDYWGTNFYPREALRFYDDQQANLVLCHNPDVCDLDVWRGYQGWILAGHTHGGQCRPPFLPPPVLPVENKTYTAGRFDLPSKRTLYINRALGHLLPVRFNVRPEITVFTLCNTLESDRTKKQ